MAPREEILLNLEQGLSQRIVGKDEAVSRIASVIRVRLTDLSFRPDRPNGSFLLVGPTGVGKNELAYALCQVLYGTEDRVVSIDLGELAEEGDLAKLAVTLLPGSETQVVEGLLTSPVRRDPGAIVLLRGLERAHPSFQPVLQQILERGKLEDMSGQVSFSQTIIIVTTRPRKEDGVLPQIGFNRAVMAPQEALRQRLERTISPELLDAFNEIIELPPLSPDDVLRIARYKVEAVLARMHRQRREIVVAETVYRTFIPEDVARRQGATSLNRTLEDRLFNPLARYLLSHPKGRPIHVDVVDGKLRIAE